MSGSYIVYVYKSSFFFWDHYISNAVDKSVPLKASPFLLLTKLFVYCLYIFCNYGHMRSDEGLLYAL